MLTAIIAHRGARPLLCVSDNGTELISTAILTWCQRSKVGWHYIAPGTPQQNTFAEGVRCNGSTTTVQRNHLSGLPERS